MDLHFERLRTLWLVSQHGTLVAVARALDVTPSAVSQQIRALESDVGAHLVEPAGRSVALTPLGVQLAARAGELLDQLEATGTEVEALVANPAGELRIAAIPSVAGALGPATMRRLKGTHPRISLIFSDSVPTAAIELLQQRRADIAIIDSYPDAPVRIPDGLSPCTLGADPLIIVAPASMGLPDEAVGLDSLRDADWVLAPNYHSGELTLAACRAAGFEPRVRWETDDLHLARRFVVEGGAVSVQPRLAVSPLPAGAVTRPLKPSLPKREIVALTRTASSGRPIVKAALDALLLAASEAMTG